VTKKAKAWKPLAKGTAVVRGRPTWRGEKMLRGPWRLISPHRLEFPATLVDTINIGRLRLAIFSVPKRVRRR
jgi:hypothetical protein